MMLTKQEFREKYKQIKLANADREQVSLALTLKLLSRPEYSAAQNILSFASLPNELTSAYLNRQILIDGKHLFLPIVENYAIGEVFETTDLVQNSRGIFEPKTAAPESAIGKLQLVILPGVVFDKQNYRLGHGSGWYDRLLARLPKSCLKVGFCFKEQIVDKLPHDSWDVKLDLIISN